MGSESESVKPNQLAKHQAIVVFIHTILAAIAVSIMPGGNVYATVSNNRNA